MDKKVEDIKRGYQKHVFQPTSNIVINNNYTKIYDNETFVYTVTGKVNKFPNAGIQGFWLKTFINQQNVSVNLELCPVPQHELINLKKTYKRYNEMLIEDREKNHVDYDLDKKLSGITEELGIAIEETDKGRKLYFISLNFHLKIVINDKKTKAEIFRGDERGALRQLQASIEAFNRKIVESFGDEMELTYFDFRQHQGLQAMFPVFQGKANTYLLATSEGLGGAFPFLSETENNRNAGTILGIEMSSGEVVAPDTKNLKHAKLAASEHMFIIGKSGSGKSTVARQIAFYDIALNKQSVIYDINRDYVHIASLMKDDSFIYKYSLSGEINHQINFFAIPKKRDGSLLVSTEEFIGILLKSFTNFIDIFKGDGSEGNISRAIFKNILLNAYAEDPSGNSINIEQIKQSLDEELAIKSRQSNYDNPEQGNEIVKIVELLNIQFEDLSSGLYKNLFNNRGPTIETDKDFIVHDFYEIKREPKAAAFLFHWTMQTQYIKFIKDEDPMGRGRRILIDEAHRFLKNKAIESDLATYLKESRGEGTDGEGIQFILSTQTLLDFARSEDGQEILNQSSAKFIFKQEPKATGDLRHSFKDELTEQDLAFISNANVGEALVVYANKKHRSLIIPDNILDSAIFKVKECPWKDGFPHLEIMDGYDFIKEKLDL